MRISVILAHPDPNSFNHAIASTTVAYEFLEGDTGEGIPHGLLKAKFALVFNTSNIFKKHAARTHNTPYRNIGVKMGASIYVYWPGVNEDEQGDHSGFSQDEHAYACWQAEMQSSWWTKRGIIKHQLEALLSIYPIGTDDEEPHIELATDLEDLSGTAEYAQERCADKLTLLVDW